MSALVEAHPQRLPEVLLLQRLASRLWADPPTRTTSSLPQSRRTNQPYRKVQSDVAPESRPLGQKDSLLLQENQTSRASHATLPHPLQPTKSQRLSAQTTLVITTLNAITFSPNSCWPCNPHTRRLRKSSIKFKTMFRNTLYGV